MTTITALPTAPSRTDSSTFSARSDALLGALDQFVTETNTVAGECVTNAATATTKAGEASTSASSASTSASSASTSASTATTQAGIATTQASNAASSATSANNSAISAAASAASIASGPVASVNGRTGIVTGVQDSLVSGTTIKTVNSTTLLGSGDLAVARLAGNTFTGAQILSDQQVSRAMFKDTGFVYYDSTTTNALDYVNGSCQRWAPNTGAQTLSIANWPPTGNLGELLIQGINLGAATITWPTINWVKGDGTTTTTFSSNGVTLQASGTDWVYLWTRDAGTTIYGKVVR